MPIPDYTEAGLLRYRDERIPTGGFLQAVLSNDLKGACARADYENGRSLYAIVAWCWNELPAIAWGSPEAYHNWLAPAPDPEVTESYPYRSDE